MSKLSGKNALITGGSSGIGLACAKLFLREGASVAITGRDTKGLASAQEILGRDVFAIRGDISKLEEIETVLSEVQSHYGSIDVLLVNAGISKATVFGEVTEAQFDEMVTTNVKGTFFTIQKALPFLNQGASVVVTTSISGRIATPYFSVYGASKAALTSLVKSLSLVLVERGIRINALCPGPIATPIFDRFGLPADVLKAKKQEITSKSPMKRFGTPDEIAKAALFLASDDSSYMTGEEIVVDGGMSLI